MVLVLGLVLSLVVIPVRSPARPGPSPDRSLGTFTIGGHIHTLATRLDQEFPGGTSADSGAVDVNSVELGMTASPRVALDANVTLLLEEGLDGGRPGDNFAVDQAFVVLAGNNRVLAGHEGREDYDRSPWYLKAGKFYVPFGLDMGYHTFDVISEPQTLALAETLESSFQVGYTPHEGLDLYGGVFSGDGGDFEGGSPSDDDIDDFFLGLNATNHRGSLGVQWTNNLNNSIALTGEAGAGANEVGGLSLYGSLNAGPALLQVAHVRALDGYTRGLLFTGSPGQPEPGATTVELTYHGLAHPFRRPLDGTLVFEQTDEWLDHPEDVYGLVLDMAVLPGVTGSVELVERDYDPAYSTVLDNEQLVAFRLAVGFEAALAGP